MWSLSKTSMDMKMMDGLELWDLHLKSYFVGMGKKHYWKHSYMIYSWYVKFIGYIQVMRKSFRAKLYLNFYKGFFYHFETLCWIRIIKANRFGIYSPKGHNFTHTDGNKINGTSMVVLVRIWNTCILGICSRLDKM